MALSSITTLVDFLRHRQRLVLVDNLGGLSSGMCVKRVGGSLGGLARDH